MRNKSNSTRLCSFAFSIVNLTVILLGAGCGTDRLPDYASNAPAATASTLQTGRESGMEIALDPFVEPQRTKQFFGINAAAEGIGIVFARISNHTTNQTFLVQKASFQLVPAGAASGQNAESKTIERDKNTGMVLEMVGAGGLLGLAGASMVAHAAEAQRNFVSKEMPDQTLAPGESMEGFIYYTPVPKTGLWDRGATMKINLTDTKSHETLSMTLPLSE
jgi:hypothetical protein